MSERYVFLTAQREDLIKAEEALLEIIKELDEEMKLQFKNSLKQLIKSLKGFSKSYSVEERLAYS